ncbi:hypothetical protein CBR_g4252 [Chara braunii]|uniref:Uncharacterized protein n=1 Tax=Chara braunii TaxID=69332 RepID=A0A388JR99_CHABU|nr:hypothetical protein CBR_g4252 [Chara braunii]|eukprot:GBG60297.1 hypothetical protein CBR_g4252 [Chara braunii]
MPQPPAGGQHPGGGGGGDGGDGSGSGVDKAEGKRSGGEDSRQKRSVGKGSAEMSSVSKGSDRKGSGENGFGGKGSGRKGSGGKGSSGKGFGGKCRAFGSGESRGTESHCEGSRDSDVRSYQVRVDSHLSARTLFRDVKESLCHSAQQAYPDACIVKDRKCERQFPQFRKVRIDSELLTSTCGPSASSARRTVLIDSELLTSPCGPSANSAPHATVLRGEENVRSNPPHLQLGTVFPCSLPFSSVETPDWLSRKVLEGLAAGVLETGASEYECHASEGAPVDFESESTAAPGEPELSQEAHDVQRKEETRHWPPRRVMEGLDAGVLETGANEHECHASEGVLETGASEHKCHASEGASVDFESKSTAAPREEELSQEGHTMQREDELLHGSSGNAINIEDTKEFLHSGSAVATTQEGDSGEEGRVWMFVEGKDRGEEGRAWTFVETRLLGDEEGEEEPVLEARLHGDEEAEKPVVEACFFGGEVSVSVQMDPERKDHDSPFTCCSEEQGVRLSMFLPMKPSKAMRGKSFPGTSLAALPKKSSSSVGLFKRVKMPSILEKVVRVLKTCGIDKEEALQKHVVASIESVTALSNGSDDDVKPGIVKDPYPKYIVKDTFSSPGYNFSRTKAYSS